MQPGETWNESLDAVDSATGRPARRLTRLGLFNNTPTYHYNSAFSADSRYLVFVTARDGGSAIVRAEVETGELTVLLATEGFGDRSRGATLEPWAPGPEGNGGFTATRTALIPATRWVVATTPSRVLAVHLETREVRPLADRFAAGFTPLAPGANASGTEVFVPLAPPHPDQDAHLDRPGRPYAQAMLEQHAGVPTQILAIDLQTGQQRVVHADPLAGCAHVLPSPTDDDLVLFDRDLPPTFAYAGDHARSPRAHLLRLSTGELTPLRPKNAHQFQSHTNWNRDGSRIYYHGPAAEDAEQPIGPGTRLGQMFLGVSDLGGDSVFEMNLPRYYYGHVSTHPRAEAIITDGLVAPDLVAAIHYEDLDPAGAPRIELLARHDTDWSAAPGQLSHPHCHISPDGKWLSYNTAAAGRADVCLVRVA